MIRWIQYKFTILKTQILYATLETLETRKSRCHSVCSQAEVCVENVNSAHNSRLVPDDNVHLSSTPHSFGTQGRLILDVAIASYSITRFYSFSIFYSIGETVAGDKPGGAAPTPNGQLRQKRKPLDIDVFQSLKRGLRKKIGCIYYSSQYGDFLPFLFRPFDSDEDATYLFPTDSPWIRLPCTILKPGPSRMFNFLMETPGLAAYHI